MTPPLISKWGMRSWVQDPLVVCVTYQPKKVNDEEKVIKNLMDSAVVEIR